MMTQSLKGKTRAEAERLFEQFHRLVTGEQGASGNGSELGKLAVFSGVCKFPARVKCATLAWHTLQSALKGDQQPVVQRKRSSTTIIATPGVLCSGKFNQFESKSRRTQQDSSAAPSFREESIWEQLRTVRDPEIPVNIVDLGLIYSAQSTPEESGRRVEVRMSLTAPGCAMSDVIKAEVERKLSALPGVSQVQVDVVFDPPWNPGMMSEAAKLQLGFDSRLRRPHTGLLQLQHHPLIRN